MMNNNFKVVRANQNELDTMLEWARKEGWNPGINDALSFYATDPCGFFLGKYKDNIIAMGSAVVYDPNYAFCGFYIVDKAYRNRGYGLALTEKRLSYTDDRCVGIDGVINMEERYTRLGYETDFISSLYQIDTEIKLIPSVHVVSYSEKYFQGIVDYDSQCFFCKRAAFLKSWLDNTCVIYIKDQQILGYGVIRPCFKGYKIGPLFADDDEIAELILSHLLSYANQQPVMIAIPEHQSVLDNWIKKYRLKSVFSVARMYRGEKPQMRLDKVYGITSYELG